MLIRPEGESDHEMDVLPFLGMPPLLIAWLILAAVANGIGCILALKNRQAVWRRVVAGLVSLGLFFSIGLEIYVWLLPVESTPFPQRLDLLVPWYRVGNWTTLICLFGAAFTGRKARWYFFASGVAMFIIWWGNAMGI